MSSLFNVFCPLVGLWSQTVESGVFVMVCLTFCGSAVVLFSLIKEAGVFSMFPSAGLGELWFFSGFLLLALLNLLSLVCFSYPVTTTLGFNLLVAVLLWLVSVLMSAQVKSSVSAFLPKSAPWYLAAFLSVIELVSLTIRPLTLCFRLLANLSAGHILFALICKLGSGFWLLGGVAFGLLEMAVAVIQAYVFILLVSIYTEEGLSHLTNSFWNFVLKKQEMKDQSSGKASFSVSCCCSFKYRDEVKKSLVSGYFHGSKSIYCFGALFFVSW